MFYKSRCQACQRGISEFEEANKIGFSNQTNVQFGRVDCEDTGIDTCSRLGITDYPSIKFFKFKEMSRGYNGQLNSVNGILGFVKSQTDLPYKVWDTIGSYTRSMIRYDSIMTGLYEDHQREEIEFFKKTAEKMRDHEVTFGLSTIGHAIGDQLGTFFIRPKHLWSRFEEIEIEYEGQLEVDPFMKWIIHTYHGLMGHRQKHNTREFREPLVIAYYHVDFTRNRKGTNFWRKRMMKIAKNFPHLNFAISDGTEFSAEVTEFGITPHLLTTTDRPFAVIKSKKGKFVMRETFTLKAFKNFLQNYDDDEIEPYVKSEPRPVFNDGLVKIVVGETFEELVSHNKNDILLLVYSPECKKCKDMLQKYGALGELMKDEEIEIAMIDITGNDVPREYKVSSLPSVYFVPFDTKKPEFVDAGVMANVQDFVKVIAQKAVEELKQFDRNGNAKEKEEL